jgi:hypothetical protein
MGRRTQNFQPIIKAVRIGLDTQKATFATVLGSILFVQEKVEKDKFVVSLKIEMKIFDFNKVNLINKL